MATTNVDALAGRQWRDLCDLELPIRCGTSTGGSAGHLALAVREPVRRADFDDLYAMHRRYDLSKYSVRVSEASLLFEIDLRKRPIGHDQAAAHARRDALTDSESCLRGLPVLPRVPAGH